MGRAFLGAVAFLTRVPTGATPGDRSQLAASIAWFPVVGALVGAAVAGAFAAGMAALPPLVASALAVGAGMVLTGALHEDGLADVADALGGGHDRDDRLRILDDPTVGAFGALALVVSSLALVAALAGLGAWQATGGLVAAHALARGGAVAVLAAAPLARGAGLAAAHSAGLRPAVATASIVAGLGIGTLAIGLWVVPSALAVAAIAGGLTWLAVRAFGGVGGDVLGAIVVLGVLAVMVVVAGAAGSGAAVTWWAR